jgi:penicillin-binding protein 1C
MFRFVARLVARLVARTFSCATPCAFLTFAIILGVWLRCGPIPTDLLREPDTPSTVVVDRQGQVLYEALSSDGSRSERIDPASLPPVLVAATLAAEDRRFLLHPGVDPIALARAARRDVMERQIVEGGSTITQQVAKLLIQRRDGLRRRGVAAKLRELVLALRLEHRFSKRELLAMYLNLASYGSQATGAARASRMYFGVPPAMLTSAQAAFLAGLPQRPTAFNPRRNVDAALARQQQVLRRMRASGTLSESAFTNARAERVSLERMDAPFLAPHFVEMVLSDAGAKRSARIETTLDVELQREIEGIIERQRPSLRRHGAANVSVVVLDNARSEWVAWEGSGDYADAAHGGAINGPVVPRQPGSALKPFTYALAFEEGRSPATVLPDIPSTFPTAEPGVLYSPRNYDGRYRGPLLARRALAGSENVPAVALASDLGVPALVRFLTRGGLSTFGRNAAYYGVGVTLGNAEVRLDELVSAYATFARDGSWRAPTFVRSRARDTAERQLVSPRTAFWITDILADADARSFIFGRGGDLEFPFPVAVKTGTSQAYHDNWTIGYTRSVTVGVWVGNFDRRPLRDSSGVTGAGPIFHAVMLAAERRFGNREASDAIVPPPAGLERRTICALSGMVATSACPVKMHEWLVIEDAEPCSWHRRTDEGLLTVYPPIFRQWSLAENQRAPEIAERITLRQGGSPQAALSIASPPAGAIYSVDPTLRAEYQALPLRAVTELPTPLTWIVDGRLFRTASSERPVTWPLVVGRHTIEVHDATGARAQTWVVVR